MPESLTVGVLTPDDLRRLVEAPGENGFIDSKGPLSWDDDETKLKLAKHIVAFANSAGGGALVIGKSSVDGVLEFTGLNSAQLKSFDTTKVAQWVNSHFRPDVELTCYPYRHGDADLIVIWVSEFSDMPIICEKQCGDKNGQPIHRRGAIYARTKAAQSVTLETSEQLSELVNLAAAKQRTKLREMIEAVTSGRSTPNIPTDEARFDELTQRVRIDLLNELKLLPNHGAWSVAINPQTFEKRWPGALQLTEVMQRHHLPAPRSFPQETIEPVPTDWGVTGGFYGFWGLTTEGLFVYVDLLREDHSSWVFNHDLKKLEVPAGQWIDITEAIGHICDAIAFAASYSTAFDSDSSLRLRIELSGLKGRRLLSKSNRMMDAIAAEYKATQVTRFEYEKTIRASNLRAEWRQLCQEAVGKVIHLFPIGAQVGNISGLVERYVRETRRDTILD